jgi:predicted nucleotidyltransferase
MISAEDILAYVKRIAERFAPHRVILFGSYAYGRPNEDSDVDLLVVTTNSKIGPRAAVEIRARIPAPFPLDLLVRNAATIQKRIAWNDFFLDEVTKKGIVLHAADDARVGEKGRRRLRRRLAAAPIQKAVPVRSNLLSRPTVRGEVPEGTPHRGRARVRQDA